MTDTDLLGALDHGLRETHFDALGERYQGKVRDTYARGDQLVLVTTDRISAFDHVFGQTIPFKGQVLNRLAAYFFERTADVAPNHVIAVPHGNVTVAHRCTPIPIEFVVRGHLAGHAWRVYAAGGRTLCGQRLPDGLRQNAPLPSPLLTPATKADEGHDEDIALADIVARGLLDARTLGTLTELALALYARGAEMARARGLILLDTKYEFGRAADGRLLVMAEMHTPDSSRYVYADGFEDRIARDEPQRQLSKEFLREWLLASGFRGEGSPPDLPDEVRVAVARRYFETFEALTGSPFIPDMQDLRVAITG